MQSRTQWETLEKKMLAPYAAFSSHSKGRKFPEPAHSLRHEYQRDRDRVIHSAAFRRLEYKTQVVPNGIGDHFRTRLTHTIEVTAIARTAARTLRLNEDLAEAIALAHDLGHPPFGHPGEDALNQIMAEHGGFEHNRQSLRIVEELEKKYPDFDGLNLTCEVLDGIQNGHTKGAPASLEAQVTDLADEIAYSCHDLDDALDHGLITTNQLSEMALWKEANERMSGRFCFLDENRKRRYLIRCLIDTLVEDLCAQSTQNLKSTAPATAQDARAAEPRLIDYSEPIGKQLKELRQFLYQHFYYHSQIKKIKERSASILEKLFAFYLEHPEHMGGKFHHRLEHESLHRTVCDYVSGMTDRYALQVYAEHINPDDAQEVFQTL